MALAHKGWYSFSVAAHLRKEEIARDIHTMFNVTVKEVHTMRRIGKMRRSGRKMIIRKRPDWKVAMVRLVKGQKIPIFDITPEGKTA